MNTTDFAEFPKIPRLSREAIVTEKIDGSNAQISIVPLTTADWGRDFSGAVHLDPVDAPEAVAIYAGSRTRWVQPGKTTDNYGFAAWVQENAGQLKMLGPGRHFGEWYGCGINRAYGLDHRRFALFNTSRWQPIELGEKTGAGVVDTERGIIVRCCHVVPLIWRSVFDTRDADSAVEMLRSHGSFAVPGFLKPEGIVVYNVAANQTFKKLLENDELPKGLTKS